MNLLLLTLGCLTPPPEGRGELEALCVDQDTEALLIEHPALAPIPTDVLDEAKLTWPSLAWVHAGEACAGCGASGQSIPIPSSAIQ